MFDEEGKEQEGKERLEAWKEAFRKLGIDEIDDADFDKAFARRVEAEARKMERESEMKECEMKAEEKENEDEKTREERARMKLNKNITDAEVSKAIDQLQNYKAPGQDGVIGEILKAGGEKIRKAVWVLCCVAWKNERVPNDWMQGVVVPLYKDGDERDPMNYRGITLLSIVGKVYNRVLGNRLMSFAERGKMGIVEEQGGFRPERGTEDQLFILTEVLPART